MELKLIWSFHFLGGSSQGHGGGGSSSGHGHGGGGSSSGHGHGGGGKIKDHFNHKFEDKASTI